MLEFGFDDMTASPSPFSQLEYEEKESVRRALLAILNGDFIDDSEFQTRLGIDRTDLAAVADSYPNIDDKLDSSVETLSINNCLNELCFGLSISKDAWSQWLDVTRKELTELYAKWGCLRGWTSTGIR